MEFKILNYGKCYAPTDNYRTITIPDFEVNLNKLELVMYSDIYEALDALRAYASPFVKLYSRAFHPNNAFTLEIYYYYMGGVWFKHIKDGFDDIVISDKDIETKVTQTIWDNSNNNNNLIFPFYITKR